MRTPMTGASAAAAGLLLLAGCSGQGAGGPSASSPTPSPSTPSSTVSSTAPATASSAPTPTTRAARLLAAAVSRLQTQNTGIYRAITDLPGVRILEQGSYQLSPLAFDVTRVYRPTGSTRTAGDQALAVRAIVVDGRLWMRVISGGEFGGTSCYLATSGPLATVAGLDVDPTQAPPAIAGLLAAQGSRTGERGAVTGSTDLYTGVGMLGQRAVAALGALQPIGLRLPAFFRLQDGRVSSWQLNLGDLARSLRATGRPVPELARTLRKTGAPIGVFLNVKTLTGKPAGATTAGPISAPDPADVVTPDGDTQEAVRAALSQCPAG